MREFNSTFSVGHGAIWKLIKLLNKKKDIQQFISHYKECQTTKPFTAKSGWLHQPIPNPRRPWLDITMDFIVQLPNSEGYITILVVVDCSSKVDHFIALKPGFLSSLWLMLLCIEWLSFMGFPPPLFPTKVSFFWVNSRNICSNLVKLFFITPQPTIHRVITRLKWSIVVWSNI